MAPVLRATIHHEGAGSPTDNVQRFADGGYSYAIGATNWYRLRPPAISFATLRFNHVSLDICLSGNRMEHPVTDHDIALIHGAFLDCLHRDEVVDNPVVVAHKNSPGSSTVCPGDFTMTRWEQVVNACRVTEIKPQPKPTPKGEPVLVADRVNPSFPSRTRSALVQPDGSIVLNNGAKVIGLGNITTKQLGANVTVVNVTLPATETYVGAERLADGTGFVWQSRLADGTCADRVAKFAP